MQQDGSSAAEELELGRPAGGRTRARVLLGAVVLGLVLVVVAVASRPGQDGTPTPLSPDSTAPGAGRGEPTATEPPARGRAALGLGPVLPDADPDWRAVWVSERAVYRVDLVTGDAVRIELPEPFDQSAVLALAEDRLLVNQPYAYTFLVELEQPAEVDASRPERTGHVDMRPGPPGHVWTLEPVEESSADVVLQLRDFDGGGVGPPRPLPSGVRPEQVLPDGSGGVLLEQQGGVWQIEADGYRRLSTGRLAAWGQGGQVFNECDDRLRCGHVLRDPSTGQTRPVGATDGVVAALTPTAPAAVSPDGRWWFRESPAEDGYELVDLTDGVTRTVDVRAAPASPDQGSRTPGPALAWTPDSRHLLVGGEQLGVVDVASGAVRGVDLPQRVAAMLLTAGEDS